MKAELIDVKTFSEDKPGHHALLFGRVRTDKNRLIKVSAYRRSLPFVQVSNHNDLSYMYSVICLTDPAYTADDYGYDYYFRKDSFETRIIVNDLNVLHFQMLEGFYFFTLDDLLKVKLVTG